MRKTAIGPTGRLKSPAALYGTVQEGCARWGVGKSKLYLLIGAGYIRAVRVGRRTALDLRSGDDYFNSLPSIGRQTVTQ
jgi:excisionase family DNA binding protein